MMQQIGVVRAACACTWHICEGCAMHSHVRDVQHTHFSLGLGCMGLDTAIWPLT